MLLQMHHCYMRPAKALSLRKAVLIEDATFRAENALHNASCARGQAPAQAKTVTISSGHGARWMLGLGRNVSKGKY